MHFVDTLSVSVFYVFLTNWLLGNNRLQHFDPIAVTRNDGPSVMVSTCHVAVNMHRPVVSLKDWNVLVRFLCAASQHAWAGPSRFTLDSLRVQFWLGVDIRAKSDQKHGEDHWHDG